MHGQAGQVDLGDVTALAVADLAETTADTEQEQRTGEEEGQMSVDTLLCTCTLSNVKRIKSSLFVTGNLFLSISTAYLSVSALFTFGVACVLVAKAFFHAGRAGERSKEQRTALLSSLSICTHK